MNQFATSSPATPLLLQSIATFFAEQPQVAAVALAGSLAATAQDEASDLDIYVYVRAGVPLEVRAALAEQHAAPNAEIGNDDFGAGDEWIDRQSGQAVDLMYFGTLWMEEQLDRVLVRHEAALGYTTAFWSTIQRSAPLVDPDGWFAHLQARANAPYPEALRKAIIAKNYPLLRDRQSSYLHQLQKAFARHDRVSLNHRASALLASYFDILFALNRVLHPGEKRLLHYARTLCPNRPEGMQEQLERFLLAQATDWADDALLPAAHALIDGMDDLLKREALV